MRKLFPICFTVLVSLGAEENQTYERAMPPTYVSHPSSPHPKNEWIIKPFGFASFLYWDCSQGGSEIAVNANSAGLSSSGILLGGSSQSMSFGMNLGFRAGAGFLLPWERTSLGGAYTYLDVKNSKNFLPGSGQAIFPLLANPSVLPVSATQAKSRWNMSFQNLDVDFEKRYNVSKAVTVLPDLGLKAAWISQHRSVDYLGLSGVFTGVVSPSTYESSDHNDFSGLGLKLGGTSLWYFGWGFGMFGLLKGALLAGNFHVKQNDTFGGQTVNSFTSKLWRMVPTVQCGIGLDWGHAFGDCAIKFSCAYEAQYWWGQNQFARFTTAQPGYVRSIDDLAFQGLTASAGISF